MNVFWLSLTSTTHVAADFLSILTTMGTSYATRFAPLMASSYAMRSCKGSWLYASGQVIEQNFPMNTTGTGGSTYATDSTSTLINWTIADYYRGGHPRTYLAGTPDAQITNGRLLASTYQTNIATAANGFITDTNAATHGGISATLLGTVRFASANAWLSPPVFRAYNGGSCAPIVANQRRRLARS